MATEAERAAAQARWQAATGAPDPQALSWAEQVWAEIHAEQEDAKAS